MKIFLTVFSLLSLILSTAYAEEEGGSCEDSGEIFYEEPQEPRGIFESPLQQEVAQPSISTEDNDPFEPVNRVIFALNDLLDTAVFDPISLVYTTIFPEVIRDHIGYVLRNLSEPIVLANNILQGEAQDAEDTLRRFLINSTVGVAGIFDVSTSLDIPYKKEDFGLTLACWGFDAGPYIVIPILGPSNVRDAGGRIVDFVGDPVNWVAYFGDSVFYSNSRTSAQIIDAKSDSEIIAELKKNIDPYATFRTWYSERRKHLIAKGDRQTLESPQPDDDDE
jgi:phospholipid-binding lipoprotein MlaA